MRNFLSYLAEIIGYCLGIVFLCMSIVMMHSDVPRAIGFFVFGWLLIIASIAGEKLTIF